MGTWLGGRTSYLTSKTGAVPEAALGTGLFWIGTGLWAAGFVGNLASDEILYNLRKPGKDGKQKPRYSIPQGFLYSKPFGGISFPAYLCEWIEWLGFAMAACSYSASPALPSLTSIDPEEIFLQAAHKVSSALHHTAPLENALGRLGTYATPPFLFFFAEVASECSFEFLNKVQITDSCARQLCYRERSRDTSGIERSLAVSSQEKER